MPDHSPDDDEEVGVCTECHSTQNTQKLIKNPFFQQGGAIPCHYCNTPDAPVWMGDFSFKPIGDIVEGDTVISMQEGGRKNQSGPVTNKNKHTGYKSRLVKSKVLATKHHKADVVRVIMASGREVTCTPNHYWWNAAHRFVDENKWTVPEVGKRLKFIADPINHTTDSLREAGWLAGMYDGEGTGIRVSQSLSHNPELCHEIELVFNKLDIGYSYYVDEVRNMMHFNVSGGWRDYLRFMQIVAPKKSSKIEQKILTSSLNSEDTIEHVEMIGSRDVVDITTETGNYVAWGFSSRNCGGIVVITRKDNVQRALRQADRERGI